MPFHRDLKGPALHGPTNERVENNSGVTIQKLQVVSLDGHGTLFPQVVLANPNIMGNFGIAMQEMTTGTNGYVTTVGFMVNVNTSAWTVNTVLYSDANGNLTTTVLGDAVARVVKQDASCGVLYVLTLGDTLGGTTPWLLDGNGGTDPDTHFLGTLDSEGLTFRTNDVQRQRIDENGRFLFGDAAEVTPKYFMHIKQHTGFAGSGNMKETAATEISDTALNNIYSFVVPNLSTVMATFRLVATEAGNTEQATFIKTATWFRQGANAQLMGIVQSDYTNKSDNNFDVQVSQVSDTVFVKVKNANSKDTRWQITVELDIMINAS